MSTPDVVGFPAGGGGGGGEPADGAGLVNGDVNVDNATLAVVADVLKVKDGGIGGTQIAAAIKDAAAGVASLRTLSNTSTTAAAGNDARFPTANEKAALAGTGTPSASDKYVNDSDSRMTNSRPPNGAAGGDLGGSYPNPSVATVGGTAAATIASNLPSAGEKAALAGTGTPGSGNKYVTNDDSRMTNTRDPNAHAASHKRAGTDEIDGDQLDIDWDPANYTPATVTETSHVDHLSSHLKGIDDQLNPELCIAVLQFGHVPAAAQYQFAKVPVGWRVSALKIRASAAGVAGTMTATKDSDGTAAAAGTSQLSTSFLYSSIAAAWTMYSASLHGTAANLVHGNADHVLCVKWDLLDLGGNTHGLQVFVYVKRV